MNRALLSISALLLFGFMGLAHADQEDLNPHLLEAERIGCHPALCRYIIKWSVPMAQQTVVTVEIPNDTPETLMACEGASGQADAPWIVPGKTYVFRVYASSQCTVDVAKSISPTSHLQVHE